MQDDVEQPVGADFLILTATEAAALAGPTGTGAALAPVALADGSFVLPLCVREDPAHQAVAATLALLPVERVEAARLPALPAQMAP